MNQELVEKHYAELAKLYPGLELEREQNIWIIKGLLVFSAAYNGDKIQDSFHVEILVPSDYPNCPPSVKEVGGRIPHDFHKKQDDSLCLAASVEVRRKFVENPSLLDFVESLVIPFLFSYCYWKRYGVMPYGELSHGYKGIMEYYHDYFMVKSESVVLRFLKILATDNYRGHHLCPCESGRPIRFCHGDSLLNLKKYQEQIYFLNDYIQCLEYVKNSGQDFSKALLDKKSHDLMKKCIKMFQKTNKTGQ
jgi:hypothetical protein